MYSEIVETRVDISMAAIIPIVSGQFILPKDAAAFIISAPISIFIMGSLKLLKNYSKNPSDLFRVITFLPCFFRFSETSASERPDGAQNRVSPLFEILFIFTLLVILTTSVYRSII